MPEDITLLCRHCGREFLFSADEQEFYAKMGLDSQPRRCKECRRVHQARHSRQKLYQAVCAACGREAHIPFRPDAARLVYCRDCYAQILAERRAERETARHAQRKAAPPDAPPNRTA